MIITLIARAIKTTIFPSLIGVLSLSSVLLYGDPSPLFDASSSASSCFLALLFGGVESSLSSLPHVIATRNRGVRFRVARLLFPT